MTIGLLDPALFLPRSSEQVQQDLDQVMRICTYHKIKLVPLEEYWDALWTDLARPLERQLTPEAKRSLQALRKFAHPSNQLQPLNTAVDTIWRRGFNQLFESCHFGKSWEGPMMKAVVRALAADSEVVLLTRKLAGRNMQQHAASHCILEEITRWVLYVQPKGMGLRQILCVHHPRNLQEKWTVRFDWRLPAAADGGRYPFCPPERWWLAKTPACRTMRSKPAWVDKHGNGWARPNTPGQGYHWDVFLVPNMEKSVGLDQINVAAFGVLPGQEKPGELHHVPDSKQGRVKDNSGWRC